MSNPLGLFDKGAVASAWFDATQQPAGWFSADLVTPEGGVPTGIAATVALNESADVLASQVSVTGDPTGIVVTVALNEADDAGAVQTTIAVHATSGLSEAADTVFSDGAVRVSASVSLSEAADSLASAVGISVSSAVGLVESSDTLLALAPVRVRAAAGIVEISDSLSADAIVQYPPLSSVVSLVESSDTLATVAPVQVRAVAAIAEISDGLLVNTIVQPPPVSAVVSLVESQDTLSAAIGDEPFDAWTAWGDSWGDAWGFSWGVFNEPYPSLSPSVQLFVLAELSKVFVRSDIERIISVAEANNLSVLRAAGALSMVVSVEGSQLSIIHRDDARTVVTYRKTLETTKRDCTIRMYALAKVPRTDVTARAEEMCFVQNTESAWYANTLSNSTVVGLKPRTDLLLQAVERRLFARAL